MYSLPLQWTYVVFLTILLRIIILTLIFPSSLKRWDYGPRWETVRIHTHIRDDEKKIATFLCLQWSFFISLVLHIVFHEFFKHLCRWVLSWDFMFYNWNFFHVQCSGLVFSETSFITFPRFSQWRWMWGPVAWTQGFKHWIKQLCLLERSLCIFSIVSSSDTTWWTF